MPEATNRTLSVHDHDRGSTGMRYVYAVLSRRAGGISIGINLNPNRRCNWRCVYCQVPGLERGSAPEIDLSRLEEELREVLNDVLHGNFLRHRAPESARALRDIAFSGDGEPTSSRQLVEIMETVIEIRRSMGCAHLPLRMISNGSYLGKPHVQQALRQMAEHGGELWFKLDAGGTADTRRINGVSMRDEQVIERLRRATECCPTWIQSCLFALDEDEAGAHLHAWWEMLRRVRQLRIPIRGIWLYAPIRASQQREGQRIRLLREEEWQTWHKRIQALGMQVRRHG